MEVEHSIPSQFTPTHSKEDLLGPEEVVDLKFFNDFEDIWDDTVLSV